MSSLAGVCNVVSYEGQAAIELEACVDQNALLRGERYDFTVATADASGMAWLDTQPLWPVLLHDIARGESVGRMAARFHNGLSHAIIAMVAELTRQHGNPWQNRIALSGGVFQNDILFGLVTKGLEVSGHTVYSHSSVPANDGGLALGQAMVAAAQAI